MVDDRAVAPIDMLRKLRQHFALHAIAYRDREKLAPIRDQQAASDQAKACEAYVRDIDATLRDWA